MCYGWSPWGSQSQRARVRRGYEPSEPENPMGWPERSHSGVDRGRRSKIVVLGSRAQRPCDTTYNGPASARGHHNHAFGIVKRRDPISPQGDAAADGDFTSLFSMSTSTSSLSPAYPRPRPTLSPCPPCPGCASFIWHCFREGHGGIERVCSSQLDCGFHA